MSVDSILSLVGMLFAVLGVLAALISYAFGLEWADVLVPFCFFVLLVCQMVRLVCLSGNRRAGSHGDSRICRHHLAGGSHAAERRFLK